MANAEREGRRSRAALVSTSWQCRRVAWAPDAVRTFVSLPAGFTAMPLAPFLFYSALGTAVWTAALAYTGVILQANLTVVGDYINIVTDVLLAVIGVMLVKRYVKCWRQRAD